MKTIIILLSLIISVLDSFGQEECQKAEEQLEKYHKSVSKPIGKLNRAYSYCPTHPEVNKLLGFKLLESSLDSKIEDGQNLLEYYDSISPGEYEVNKVLALIQLSNGKLQLSKNRLYESIAALSGLDDSDSTKFKIYELLNITRYIDTLQYLGVEAIAEHTEKFEWSELDTDKINRLAVSPFKKEIEHYFDSLTPDERRLITRFQVGIDEDELTYNPYYYYEKAEIFFEKDAKVFRSSIEYGKQIGPNNFSRPATNYEEVLRIFPHHRNSLIRLADINYFNRDFEESKDYYYKILNTLTLKEKIGNIGIEAYRMIRRIEWIESIDGEGNSVKKNVLYHDKGRLNQTLMDFGATFGEFGLAASQGTGQIEYAVAGAALNIGSQAITSARLSTKWFTPAYQERDYERVYEKSSNQLVRQINNTGFYSPNSILLLCGITESSIMLRKSYEESKLHYRALVDIVHTSKKKDKFYLESAIKAGLFVVKKDTELTDIEIFRVISVLEEFEKTYKNEYKHDFIPSSSIKLIERRKSEIIDNLK